MPWSRDFSFRFLPRHARCGNTGFRCGSVSGYDTGSSQRPGVSAVVQRTERTSRLHPLLHLVAVLLALCAMVILVVAWPPPFGGARRSATCEPRGEARHALGLSAVGRLHLRC